jgi:Ser/Thr protein kinase RdoA (MazF antagonist)
MAKSTAEILDIIDEYGLPAAVKAIVRVYNEVAPVNDPHSAFWPPFANACVHVARWELGHDKRGEQRFEPKRVTDPRFKRLVSGLIPPGGSVEDLVMELGRSCSETLARHLHMEECIREEDEIEEFEDLEQSRLITISRAEERELQAERDFWAGRK